MKLKSKLILGFSIILLLIITSSLFFWYFMERMKDQTSQITHIDVAANHTLNANVSMLFYIMKGTPKEAEETIADINNAAESMAQAIEFIKIEEQDQRAKNVLKGFDEFKTYFNKVESLTTTKSDKLANMMDAQKLASGALGEIISQNDTLQRGDLTASRYEGTVALHNAKDALYASRIAVRTYMSETTESHAASAKEAFNNSIEKIDVAAKILTAPENQAQLKVVRENFTLYSAAFNDYLSAQEELDSAIEAANAHTNNLIEKQDEMVNFAYGRFEQIQSSAAAVNTVITLLALLISIVVSIALIISITRPINAALQFGKLVGGGDFSARWKNTGKDELSQLASVLNTAFDKVADKVVWFENILDSLPNPVSVTDNNMNWTFLNKAGLEMLGKTRSEIMGKPCSGWGASICNTPECGINCLKNSNKDFGQTQFTQGSNTMSVDSSYIHDSSGAIIGHIELIVDISEAENLRKEAAEASVRSRLETVSALEGVVEIVSTASEELSAQIEQSNNGASQVAYRMSETATAM